MQGIQHNSISGTYVFVLFGQFCFMVVERVIYLNRSFRLKALLQFVSTILSLAVVHIRAGGELHSANDTGLLLWLLCNMCYLGLGALQLSYGYPLLMTGQWLTRRVHWFMGYVFLVYRSVPFMYELRVLLDWTCTATTLYLNEWMKFEDIYTHLYLAMCDIHFKQDEARRKGSSQPLWRKMAVGALAFGGLCVLIWFPLLLFSSSTSFPQPVTQVSVSLGIRGFPSLYEMEHYEYLSPLSTAQATTGSADCTFSSPPSLQCMHKDLEVGVDTLVATETFSQAFEDEIQVVRMFRSSGRIWDISDPSKETLKSILLQPVTTVNMELNVKLWRQVEGASPSSMEKTFTFPLNEATRLSLAAMLNSTVESLQLPYVIPPVLRLFPSNEIDYLPKTTASRTESPSWTNCTLQANVQQQNRQFWSLSCPVGQLVHKDINVDPTSIGPSFYVISSKATFGTFLLGAGTIIGLYLTVVISVGRFLRLFVVGIKRDIMYDDLRTCTELFKRCLDVWHARMFHQLDLEEVLYETIIDIYRTPDSMFTLTKPYKHWWADVHVHRKMRRLAEVVLNLEARKRQRPPISSKKAREEFADAAAEIAELKKTYFLKCRRCLEDLFEPNPEGLKLVQEVLRRSVKFMPRFDGSEDVQCPHPEHHAEGSWLPEPGVGSTRRRSSLR